MRRAGHEIVTVGGGLGGAALAVAIAKTGAQVVVVERETCFQSRRAGNRPPSLN